MYYRIFSTWRLIAALVIMIYHFAHYGPEGREIIIERLERMLPMLDMFFIISGFLIFTQYQNNIGTAGEYRTYLLRRFARIYPLHLITLAFFVAIALAGHFGVVKTGGAARYDLTQLMPNLLLVQAWGVTGQLSLNYVSWSLSAEWFCYILLPVIAFSFRRAGTAGLLLLLTGYIICLEALSHSGIMPFKSWLTADTWGAWRAFADFIIGAVLACAVTATSWKLKSHWPAWLAILVALAAMQMQWPPYSCIFLVTIALFLAALAEQNAPERAEWLRFAAPVAAVSFGIYMWHPVMETLTYQYLWPKWLAPYGLLNFYVFMAVPMVVTIIIARVSSNYYEKWAARWILNRFGAPAASGSVLSPRVPAAAE